jgi:hypothetical protein
LVRKTNSIVPVAHDYYVTGWCDLCHRMAKMELWKKFEANFFDDMDSLHVEIDNR